MGNQIKVVNSESLIYSKAKTILLKNSSEFNENWVRDVIADDPSILGLGELVLKDKERIQPKAGRLDLLLQDTEEAKRYEVELQLGNLDESHIIRTIEYWDLEKKRYPQYDHTAVIIAEDITTRFLNVLNLLNGQIPIIALQMTAFQVDEKIILSFIKVLDETKFGLIEEDEIVSIATNREYWITTKSNTDCMKLVDECLEVINSINPGYSLNYCKHYIGLYKAKSTDNFVVFKPRKGQHSDLRMEVRIPKNKEADDLLETSEVEYSYVSRRGRYEFSMRAESLRKNINIVQALFKLAMS